MSSDFSYMGRMRFQPLRMRRIMWPMRRRQIFPTYLKSLTPIVLFTVQLVCTSIQTIRVIRQNSTWLCVKHHICRLHAQNHVSLERGHKSVTTICTIVLGDHDFLSSMASNFGNLAAFWATFTHIFTVHVQKRLFISFRLKLWQEFESLTTISQWETIFQRFEDVFCWFFIRHAECPPYFYFRFSGLVDLLT